METIIYRVDCVLIIMHTIIFFMDIIPNFLLNMFSLILPCVSAITHSSQEKC